MTHVRKPGHHWPPKFLQILWEPLSKEGLPLQGDVKNQGLDVECLCQHHTSRIFRKEINTLVQVGYKHGGRGIAGMTENKLVLLKSQC